MGFLFQAKERTFYCCCDFSCAISFNKAFVTDKCEVYAKCYELMQGFVKSFLTGLVNDFITAFSYPPFILMASL